MMTAVASDALTPVASGLGDRVSPWNVPLASLQRQLDTSPGGLSSDEAARRLAKFGPNDTPDQTRRQLWRQIVDRFANPLILILLPVGLAAAKIPIGRLLYGHAIACPYCSAAWAKP